MAPSPRVHPRYDSRTRLYGVYMVDGGLSGT